MFKKLEQSWNAHTPVYLHNGTKENFIFQLVLTVILLGSMFGYEAWRDRRDYPALYSVKTNKK